MDCDPQDTQKLRGNQLSAPHSLQRSTSNSSRSHPSQNGTASQLTRGGRFSITSSLLDSQNRGRERAFVRPIALNKRNLRIDGLIAFRLATELPHRLEDHEETPRVARVAVSHQAPVGVPMPSGTVVE